MQKAEAALSKFYHESIGLEYTSHTYFTQGYIAGHQAATSTASVGDEAVRNALSDLVGVIKRDHIQQKAGDNDDFGTAIDRANILLQSTPSA